MKKLGLFLVLFLIFPLIANADIIYQEEMYLSASAPTEKISLSGGTPTLNVYLDYELTSDLLDSKEVFCVENANGILEESFYTLITLDEIDNTNLRAKYQTAANIAEEFYNTGENGKAAAQVAIWDTVFDWDNSDNSVTDPFDPLNTGLFRYDSSNYLFDDAEAILALAINDPFPNTNNWWLAISPWTDFNSESGSFSELLDGQNYMVRMSPVPEPATMLLFGIGIIGLAGIGRKRLKEAI